MNIMNAIVIANAVNQFARGVVTAGLQMWQKMNLLPWTGSSRLLDASGNNNNATTFTGRGLSFDGVNDVITIGNTGNTVRSVVFLAYPDTTTQKFMQLTASGGVDIGITSGTLSGAGWTSPTYYVNGVASTTVAATTWQQIAVTSATAITASDVRLGLDNTTYYSGDLCNVKFFSVQLTAAQIAELYANPELAFPTGTTAADLVDWWPLAEGAAAGIALDGATVKNNGTLSGPTDVIYLPNPCPQWAFKGNSWPMFFDNVDDYINVGTIVNMSNDFTFSAWFNVSNGSNEFFFGTSSGLGVRIVTNMIGIFEVGVQSICTVSFTDFNRTYHIAATRTGNTFRLYINGVNVATGTNSVAPGSQTVLLGRRTDTATYFGGYIYNAAFFDDDLSANAISSIYSAGISHDLRTNTGNYTQTTNLKGYWVNTGNQNSDWLDLSGNGNNGTVNGSPGRVFLPEGTAAGKDLVGMNLAHPNLGAMFVPTSGYLTVGDAAQLDLTTNFSIEFWVKINFDSVSGYIIYKGATNGYRCYFLTSYIRMIFNTGGADTNLDTTLGSVSLGTWTHYVCTFDGSNVRLYLNGLLNRTIAHTTAVGINTETLYIGYTTAQIDEGFIGNVRIYNSVLTADEILQNYNVEKNNYLW